MQNEAVLVCTMEDTMWLTGLRIILPDGEIDCGSIQIMGDRIVAVVAGDRPALSEEPWFDGRGLVALPGLIDLYGDLLERELEPRPGSLFPIEAALHEVDKRLAGAGITTAYLALTLDVFDTPWRSRRPDHVSVVARTLMLQRATFLSDLRVHLQCSSQQSDAPSVVDRLLAEGLCDLIGVRDLAGDMAQVAESAGHHAIPVAIHQLSSAEQAADARELGIRVSMRTDSLEIAQSARDLGFAIAVSAPNLLRSQPADDHHNAREAVRQPLATLFVSDESPISLLAALFMLEREQLLPLYAATALVTTSPAAAVGLNDRGAIAAGLLADLVLVAPGQRPEVRMTIRHGVPIYQRATAATVSANVDRSSAES